MNHLIFSVSLSLVVLGADPLSAGCAEYTTGAAEDELFLAVRVQGEADTQGNQVLKIETGPVATRAVRIYSQPSNTLLAYMADKGFHDSDEGAAWRQLRIAEEPLATTLSEELPGAAARIVLGTSRPATDSRIQVWIDGCWPDGIEEERLIADGAGMTGADWAFSTHVELDAPPGDP